MFIFCFTVSDSATNSTDGNESASMSSESNLYSVFGGEFVASKHGKPLGRERCGYFLRCFYFVITFFIFFILLALP